MVVVVLLSVEKVILVLIEGGSSLLYTAAGRSVYLQITRPPMHANLC